MCVWCRAHAQVPPAAVQQQSTTPVAPDQSLFNEVMGSLQGLSKEVGFGRERLHDLAQLHNNLNARIDGLRDVHTAAPTVAPSVCVSNYKLTPLFPKWRQI